MILVSKLTARWRQQSNFKNAGNHLLEYIEGWGHQKMTLNGQGNRFKVFLILVSKLTARWRHQSKFKNAGNHLLEYIKGWGHQKMT